jgi:hypothetical protein
MLREWLLGAGHARVPAVVREHAHKGNEEAEDGSKSSVAPLEFCEAPVVAQEGTVVPAEGDAPRHLAEPLPEAGTPWRTVIEGARVSWAARTGLPSYTAGEHFETIPPGWRNPGAAASRRHAHGDEDSSAKCRMSWQAARPFFRVRITSGVDSFVTLSVRLTQKVT